MKIVSWNINSVRLRLPLLHEFVSDVSPDVILLQETKTQDQFFPLDECKKMGYEHIHIRGQKSYNGVAILSNKPITSIDSYDLCNDDARHISAVIENITIHNFYIPAGGDEPDPDLNPKFAHKLQYVQEMTDIFKGKTSNNTIIAGDFNIAPFEHDVWSSRQLRNVISHTEIERERLLKLCEEGGFVDIARQLVNQDEKLYSWWSYRNRDWKKSNRGRRLDHIWCSADLADNIQSFNIQRLMRDSHKPSDHVPVMIELKL